ncbi:MAG: NAD(P)-binding protein [Planctomycetes bacterium]|nr:NAD(P)-binding protein [Planctomycetota bacterium]
MPKFAILGSGMAGFGAAHRLHAEGIRPTLYEMKSHHGGHTASHRFAEGFVLDEGPHISFTKNERLKDLFAESVEQEYEESQARVNNYWRGHWIDHPAQCNLHGVPDDLKVQIICDLAKQQQKETGEIENYEQWLRASFGDTFAETFPMEYTKKYHTTAACNLSTDWIGPRVYQASLEEVVRGAVSANAPGVHYITQFRYPKQGGFVSFLKSFLEQADLKLEHKLKRLDPRLKTLTFENGVTESYEHVASSIPLPELVPMIEGVPREVVEAAQKLACSEVVVVSVGIDRPDPLDAHWSYFYDADICFTRLSTPHLQSRENVPAGHACLMAECYYSDKYRPLDCQPSDCIERVVADLRRVGVIRPEDNVVFTTAMHLKYANVIFDLDRAKALEIVHGFLEEIKVAYCGRYGMWAYIWTDQSFLSGEKAAEQILQHAGTSASS